MKYNPGYRVGDLVFSKGRSSSFACDVTGIDLNAPQEVVETKLSHILHPTELVLLLRFKKDGDWFKAYDYILGNTGRETIPDRSTFGNKQKEIPPTVPDEKFEIEGTNDDDDLPF